jgi:cell wall-associated NlpC family hydrolase
VQQPRKTLNPLAWKTEADRWIGVKYLKGGSDRGGIDSPALTAQIYRTVAAIELPRSSEAQSRVGTLVPKNDLRPGDLVCFHPRAKPLVDHVGIYLGDTKFVHVSPSKGVVVSSLLQDYYAERFHSARRVIP